MVALPSVLGVLALVVLLARLRVPLALALLLGTLVLCAVHGQGFAGTAAILGRGLVRDRTVGMAVVTALQILLAGMMDVGGLTPRIVALTHALLRRPAASAAALPALIGLLPMPGGALFSAPMVEEVCRGHEVAPAHRSALNYWYRHIWEHTWPLYPGLILALTLLGVSWPELAARQVALGAFMVLGGLPLLLRLPPAMRARGPAAPAGALGQLARALLPVATIVLAVIALTPVFEALPEGRLPAVVAGGVRQFGPIGVGLVLALGVATGQARLSRAAFLGLLRRSDLAALPVLVVAVMVFQAALDQLDLAGRIAVELHTFHIPVLAVIVVLPFLAGFSTGLAVGFVGTSFPIVLPLAESLAHGGSVLPWAVVAYGFGHLGQMSSPIHLCMVVSNRHFGASYAPVYRLLAPVFALTVTLTCAYLAVLLATAG